MRRRTFLTLAGAAVAAAVAQQLALGQQAQVGAKRIGVLWSYAADDPALAVARANFVVGLASQGWHDGANLRVDHRYGGSTAELAGPLAAEIMGLRPDVVAGQTSVTGLEFMKLTKTTPIVFFSVAGDPVMLGLVDRVNRPSGNVTGIAGSPASTNAKRVDVLKAVAPDIRTAGFMYDPDAGLPEAVAERVTYFTMACASNGLEPVLLPVRSSSDIVEAMSDFATAPNRGLVVGNDSVMFNFRDTLLAQVARYRLPAVYPVRSWEDSGGMVVYAADNYESQIRGGEYVGRVLNGMKIGDLPVQFPTKYILTINLKAAGALGITIPPGVLAYADQVIQ